MREKELIVYKDFGLDTSLLMDMVWLMEHYGSGEEGVQTVSYTHLDVYKRQFLYYPRGSILRET